jgi:hypothetical protein
VLAFVVQVILVSALLLLSLVLRWSRPHDISDP